MASEAKKVGRACGPTSVLQLFMSRDAQNGGNSSSISIDWTLEKNLHRLTSNVFLLNESQAFSFDFSAPDINKPVNLTDLATQIGLPDIPTPIAGVLDAVFQVSSLSMSYSRPGNNVEIAWTRPLGEGIMLMEYNQSSYIQTAPLTTRGSSSKTSLM